MRILKLTNNNNNNVLSNITLQTERALSDLQFILRTSPSPPSPPTEQTGGLFATADREDL